MCIRDRIKAAEDQIGLDNKAKAALIEHNRKLDNLHAQMLEELKLTRGQKRARAAEQKRISDEMNRPTRTAQPVQRPIQDKAQAQTERTATPGQRHYTKDGRLTLPPLPNFNPDGAK